MASLCFFTARTCRSVLLQGLHERCICLAVRNAKTQAIFSLPEKPKRPPSSWLLFLTERLKELRDTPDYHDVSLMEMSKRISEEWRNFDELDKIPYKEKYEEALNDYRQKMQEYKVNLSAEDKRLLKSIKSESKQDLRAFEKEIPKPKHPGNGYILFVKSCVNEFPRTEDVDMKDWIRECAKRWQQLDEGKKTRLNDEAFQLRQQYQLEMKEWKAKFEVDYV